MATSMDNEGIYYRAILFMNDDFHSLSEIFKNGKIVEDSRIVNSNYKLYNITVESLQKPPLYLEKHIKEINGNYIYTILGFDIIGPHSNYFFIASPITDLLIKNTEIFNNKYCLCNLKKLCNRNLLDINRKNIRITRLNTRINDEKSNYASSMFLYGEDIIKSNIIKYILEGKSWEARDKEKKFNNIDNYSTEGEPFTPSGKIPKIDPSSCRVVLDIDSDVIKYGLNIDKYGNYSFYLNLKNNNNLSGLINMLQIFIELKILENTTEYNPLLRSDSALLEIE